MNSKVMVLCRGAFQQCTEHLLELYSSSRPYNRTSPRHAPQVAFLVMSDCDLQLPLYRRTCCPRQLEARNVSTVANIYLDRRYADRCLGHNWSVAPLSPRAANGLSGSRQRYDCCFHVFV